LKLLARFNLIFASVFTVGILLATWLASMFLQADAKAQVLAQAKLMMLTTLASRSYTSQQINPLLEKQQKHATDFLAQTVPSYAATQIFGYLHKEEPAYAYKEATLNPTNPVDRASDWEADLINEFRNHDSLKELSRERPTPTGNAMFYARPIRVTEPACLECHSTARHAPAALLRQYGSTNGFGWKLNEVVGAQIVSVPESLPLEIARRQLQLLVTYMIVLAVIVLLILDLLLLATVIRPVRLLCLAADNVSRGNMNVKDIPVTGQDEMSVLAAAFNRMQRSLAKAMKMLGDDGSA
jgi:protein-histidine pros-kinase